MAEKDIIQNMISQLGQSQGERMAKALDIHFADVDERSTGDLLQFAEIFAPLVRFYRDNPTTATADWPQFFKAVDDAAGLQTLQQGNNNQTKSHLALFLAFLELYREPQKVLNRFTGRHLDFYYRDVLRLGKKPALADKAHVLVELKKLSRPIVISPAEVFSAGKDNIGVELLYAPTGETVVNVGKVDSLRSLFVDASGHGAVHYAPVANSSDGVGGALPEEDRKWRGFGYTGLPFAEVGFAVASPLLRMKEGGRKITVTLALKNIDPKRFPSASLKDAFTAFITAEKNWASLDISSATLSSGGVLLLELTVHDGEKAIVDYSSAIHGYQYTAVGPVLQLLLNTDQGALGYNDFKNVTVEKIKIEVTVDKITALNLENDAGVLDAKKAFLPFGPQPAIGSLFSIGCDEALSKKLSKVEIAVQWKGAPSNFETYYKTYGDGSVNNNHFTAVIFFADAGGTVFNKAATLFDSGNASSPRTFDLAPGLPSYLPPPTRASHIMALSRAGGGWTRRAIELTRIRPVFGSYFNTVPEARPGFIQFQLQTDFMHAAYRTKYVENVMTYSKEGGDLVVLNEPYTPAIQSISLSYQAHSDEVDVSSTDLTQFSNLDVQFFHVAYFGQMREHGYQRSQFSFLPSKSVSLLPVYEHEGELLIGFSNLKAGDSVSVLFEVAEGSANPELAQEPITWAALCENYWKTLDSKGVALDTTNQLLTSGIIQFVIPAEATTQNTILSANHIWLRGGVTKNVTAVGQLIAVEANAVEVQFQDHGNDPAHLTSALEAGKIAKLKNGLAPVKTVQQPYASFGGAPVEADNDFYRRVSERLRHKERCITAWDYERIILEAFPRVHKVKCIPHAREGGWLAPGHVLVIVVPDLRNKNAMDPLQPKVDANTISRITEFVGRRTGMQVQVKVKNPSYQKIQLDFKVQFRTGNEFNYYSEQLKQQLIEFLSPWAFASDRDISFGGKIYKSIVLDFVEDLPPVDYITDFKMYTYTEDPNKVDVNEARPETPDAILVSAENHIVNQAD
ncbi:MAG: hypothetical protein QOD12_855 [Verrucomicrobiota bacterium]|jgi:hypothetical protein